MADPMVKVTETPRANEASGMPDAPALEPQEPAPEEPAQAPVPDLAAEKSSQQPVRQPAQKPRRLPREGQIDALREELEKESRALLRAMDQGEAGAVLHHLKTCSQLQQRVRRLHEPKARDAYVNSPAGSGPRMGFHAALLAAAEEEGLPLTGSNLRYQCGPVRLEVDPQGNGVRVDGKFYPTCRVPQVVKLVQRRLGALGRTSARQWSPEEFAAKLVEAYQSLSKGRARDVALIEVYRWFLKDSGSSGLVYPKRAFAEDLGRVLAQAGELLKDWRLSLDPVRDARLAFVVVEPGGQQRPVGSVRLSKGVRTRG